MGRLIDVDNFKQQIAEMAIVNNYPAEKANALCELIDAQPTAYDVDAVVEQLEEKVKEYDKRIERRKGDCYFDETETIKALEERARGIEIAIEIVKIV